MFSTRKSRELNSRLRENVAQWKNRQRVRKRRGPFKNLRYNPCGFTIDKEQPLKQRGCLLVDRTSLRATLGKRRSQVGSAHDVRLHPQDAVDSYCLAISDGRLVIQSGKARAYEKNLAFLQGSKRSCRQLKYVAYFICDFGITVRLYRKLALAATLVRAGKPNSAYKLYRHIAARCWFLRQRLSEPVSLAESDLSSISSF